MACVAKLVFNTQLTTQCST